MEEEPTNGGVERIMDAQALKNGVSDDEDEVEPIPRVEKKIVIPAATKKEFVKPETPVRRSVSCPNIHKHMVPRTVLMKTSLKTVNNARTVNTVRSVNTVRPFSTARSFNTVRPSYTAHSNSQLNDFKGFVVVDAQRHMSGNIAHLSDFKDFDGVAKATSEESMLWHRRLGHVNFKNINKLSKKILSDNRTEFKNKVMDEFCREKGIKREYSVARTPQQNGVAERKNRTLIEAARTMLADSKLPTTFWAEAVSTACYIQLGKFDGKSDEGFFVGYSLSSKAFRVYNIRTRKVQENLHIGFLENKPMIEGNGPKWLFDLDSLTQSMNYVPVVAGTFSNDFAGIQGVSESSTSSQQDQDWIAMPIWKDASYFGDASPNIVDDAQIEDKDELHDEDDATEESHDGSNLQNNGTADQQVNTARQEINPGSREVSTALPEVNTASSEDLVGPIPASEDTQVEDQEIELGNIPQSYAVPTTPHTRIHKDHPIEHVIGDVQSSVQTRRMKTSYSELGFISAIYKGKTHK
ncbi:putative ribonuclease H-like domain-containing protein, partial [Tanacetum coccineum]